MDKIIERIKGTNNFVITSHISPDGDNVGSSVAMTLFLRKMGKKADHILADEAPDNLLFLTKKSEMRQDAASVELAAESYDIIILDCAEKSRIALPPDILDKGACLINVDHHMSNDAFGDINYVRPSISSTSELVCGILRELDEQLIDADIATSLYTGISTDTGNFMYPSVTSDTFRSAALLTERGADRTLVANELYRNTSMAFRMLTKRVLDTFVIDNQVGTMYMTQQMLQESQVDYKDTDLLVNMAIDTKGVAVGILIKEFGPGVYKISLRSKSKINVCDIASTFGGGGHFNASGCTIKGELQEIQIALQQRAEEQIHKDHL